MSLFVPESEIAHNVKIKSFPLAGIEKMTVCNRPIFREPGWEPVGSPEGEAGKPQDPDADPRADNVRRAKDKVFELALLNTFTHFVTWTLSPQEIDRYDPAEVSKKLKKYLQNQVQRRAAAYIVIPERHKDGAIHMHGLIRGNFDFEDSGRVTVKSQKVYNMPQWTLGFSTAVELDGNVQRIARYITKYITKALEKIFGNFYYAGGDLIRKPAVRLLDADFDGVQEREYIAAKFGDWKLAFKYVGLEMAGEEVDDYDIA